MTEHPDFPKASPTPDHFAPLLYLAGLADEAGTRLDMLIKSNMLGSVSMASYGLGVEVPMQANAEGAEGAPLPAGLPPEYTNM